MAGVPVWRRGRDLAHQMQTAGELAGLEGTISLSGTEHTGVSAAPFRERRRDRFRDGKQRLFLSSSLGRAWRRARRPARAREQSARSQRPERLATLTSKEERQRWPRRLYAGIQTDSDRKLLLGRGAYKSVTLLCTTRLSERSVVLGGGFLPSPQTRAGLTWLERG